MPGQKELRVYKRRWEAIRADMKKKRQKALVVSGPHNIRYLCCAHTPSGPMVNHAVIPVKGEPFAITSSLEEFRAREECAIAELRVFAGYKGIPADGRDPVKLLKKELKARKIDAAKVKFDANIKGIRSPTDPLVVRMRAIKDREELELITKACRATDAGARKLRGEYLRSGRKELQVAADLDADLRSRPGVQLNSFETIVAAGRHSAFSHHDCGEGRIKKNDVAICDFGVYVGGYVSDLTRTYAVGEPSAELRRIHSVVARAQKDAMDKVEVGVLFCDIEGLIRDQFKKEGYDRNFVHSTGHGIGLEVHEGPAVSLRSKEKVKPGHVFTVEPGIYVPGVGGVRIEDDVAVDLKGKVTVLTRSTRAL